MPCPRAFLGAPADRPAPRRGAAAGTRRGGGARADPRRTIGEYPPDTSFRGSPANTSRLRRRWAAGSSSRPGSPATGPPNCRRGSSASCRAGIPPTSLPRGPSARGLVPWGRPGATELSDFSVCTSWGIRAKHLYLIERRARALRLPGTEAPGEGRASPLAGRCRPDRGQGLGHPADLQELLDGGMHAATRYRPQADRIMRIYAQTAMIENGFVHLPETAPWLALYLYELSCFPYGRHDDQVPPHTLFRGRRRRCSTGSKRPGAKTASSPITACSQRSAPPGNETERSATGGAATPWSDICPTAQVFSRSVSVRACFRSQAIQRAPDEVWKVLDAGASVSVLISFEFLLWVESWPSPQPPPTARSRRQRPFAGPRLNRRVRRL